MAARDAMTIVGKVINPKVKPPTKGADLGTSKKLRKIARPRSPKTIEGTAARLEEIAAKYQVSKGTYLDMIDFRLQLEQHYKDKLELLEQGVSVDEIKTAVWKDFGLNKENVFDD